MKKTLLFAVAAASFAINSIVEAHAEQTPGSAKRVLVVGLNDNVKSNYYYSDLIAREIGLASADSVAANYNQAIGANIVELGGASKVEFRFVNGAAIGGDVRVDGDADVCHSDLGAVPDEQFQKMMNDAGADYLLVLNRHYLKRQTRPMQTLFHFVSYSLFDSQRNDLMDGSSYFTSIELEKMSRIRKISRKLSSKIVDDVVKRIEK